MTMRRLMVLFVVGCGAAHAQSIGSVGIQDATVTGPLEVSNGRAVLVGNTTVTARDHTADIALSRGGALLVCSTSGLHVTAGKSTGGPLPLMLALDRGAIEVRMAATTSDIVMTPDLRFTLRNDGTLDLRIRVTRNGDTCVENRGEAAPTLSIADQFGDGRYELRAGQHVLFEHGSLKEVVDHESSPCGCPPVPVVSVADAGVTSAIPVAPGSTVGGCMLINCIKAELALRLTQAGKPPKVLSAGAVVGNARAKELFESAYDEHAHRIAKLYANVGNGGKR